VRDDERCSFCGSTRSAVWFLIDGPRVFICNACVGACTALLPDDDIRRGAVVYRPAGSVPPRSLQDLLDLVGGPLGPQCSFCGKRPDEVKAIVEGYAYRICDECLALCRDILEEKGVPLEAAP
jgi:ATP-dependent protease Clp ATPase subunit